MAKAGDQVRASDVTFWGVVALACWGTAVLSANLSALVPTGLFAGLHSSRLDGGTVGQLRSQVAALSEESVRMRRENNLLLQRFTLAEQARGEVTRRVGALEISVPELIEQQVLAQLPRRIGIDNSTTASIGERPLSYETDGGSVSIMRQPLVSPQPPTMPDYSALTDVPIADADVFGVALGFPVAADEADVEWQSFAARVGTLLIGLAPLLQPTNDGSGQRIVAGPVDTAAQAEALCKRLDLVGIPCEAVNFTGSPLPLLN